MALADLLGQLDPDPSRRGRQFERVCQWFLSHAPVYAHELRHVWQWKDWPGRWGADAGIDLVAEDRHGHLWAIQAKAYDPATWITKRDVDTFLAESARSEFSFRLLIATTNLIGHTAKRTIEAQEKQASVLLLGDLESAEIDWPPSPSDLRRKRLQPKRPRPHQRQAIKSVVKGFDRADRGQLIMACGTGKTLAALFIHEKLAAERTLMLVPSLSLLKQTLREWTANTTVGFDFLPVCSDETVGLDPDAAVSNISDLGFPVTADAEQIATFLRRRSGPRVVFATYQSSPEIAKAFRLGRLPGFDLAIADEAHRCAGRVSSDFATILDAKAIKARRRLFMTATPRYFTGRVVKEAKESEFEVASMDNAEAFGPVFHRLGFAEAINRDLLTDYQVVVVGVDDATYRDWAQQGRFVTLDGTKVTDARTLAGQIGLAKAIRRYDLHRTITFHSRVKRAREFARELPEVIAWMPARQRPKGQLWSDYASGEMPAGQRHMLLDRLRSIRDDNERGLLANARCLSEGVDVPTLDGVAFIDPRRSEVDIVQAVGRAIRLAAEKTVGTIVIPVFIDTDEDPATALDDSAFKPVWDVIKALRSHDEELGDQLDELRRQLGRRGGRPRLPSKIHFDLPARVDIVDFARAFDVRAVEKTTTSWEFWFGMLERFVQRHGRARVPQSYKVDGYELGSWIGNQRQSYAVGRLDADRQRRLQDLPGWTWNVRADQWEEGFTRLLDYIENEGDARVPVSYRIDGYPLGEWVSSQRDRHNSGILQAHRERRLEDLPGWSWGMRHPNAAKWEDSFSRLLDYVKRHGDARVPRSYTIDGYPLGVWVGNQRQKNRQGKQLGADRQRRLQDLPGWTWDTFADWWEEGFTQLLSYAARNGDARVPRSYEADGYPLGEWVKEQRTYHNRGKLEADRERRLEELPGWSWDLLADRWEEGFSRLLDYAKGNGSAFVPVSCQVDDFRLGAWAATQRNFRKRGLLDADRERRLEELPGWSWDLLADRWEEGFRQLLRFVKDNGDARVPQSCTLDGFPLGTWVGTQRDSYSQDRLDADRQRRLEELPGWSWDTATDRWEEGFSRLLDYAKGNGSAFVPVSCQLDDFRLGAWAVTQRNFRKRGLLDADRERRLEELPGWSWEPYADRWEEGFRQLLRFVKDNGDARVPASYKVDGYSLGGWVKTQRRFYSEDRLDDDRRRRLQELPGWTWKATP
ncbi:DEAD/DEAH box helicase [Mycobacterium marinum]|uniref:DEAD/DEAH box helicase n=1 Tax=Mycobacterium marinum TaxID=1781 RepID=UPI001FB61BF0|nr:DEAD/DEAH box helicase [Mycobacterium marinum]